VRQEDLPEDINGKQDENPYTPNPYSYLYPYRGQSFWPLDLWWKEREYWRHWGRVKRDTGHWPFWSAVYHLLFIVLISINTIMFVARRKLADWSASKSGLIFIAFVVLWIAIFFIGRGVIRGYEAKLYTLHEEDKRHSARRG